MQHCCRTVWDHYLALQHTYYVGLKLVCSSSIAQCRLTFVARELNLCVLYVDFISFTKDQEYLFLNPPLKKLFITEKAL